MASPPQSMDDVRSLLAILGGSPTPAQMAAARANGYAFVDFNVLRDLIQRLHRCEVLATSGAFAPGGAWTLADGTDPNTAAQAYAQYTDPTQAAVVLRDWQLTQAAQDNVPLMNHDAAFDLDGLPVTSLPASAGDLRVYVMMSASIQPDGDKEPRLVYVWSMRGGVLEVATPDAFCRAIAQANILRGHEPIYAAVWLSWCFFTTDGAGVAQKPGFWTNANGFVSQTIEHNLAISCPLDDGRYPNFRG